MSPEAETQGIADPGSANVVEALTKTKEPPAETRESRWTRRLVLLSFWAVAVFLGLPVWWKTTTVYRAPLPLQDMLDWADGKVWVDHGCYLHT
jgi:phosphatidylinositol glycan class S